MTQMFAQKQNFESTVAPLNPIKVLIVDDSKLIRRAVRGLLESDPEIVVVGEPTAAVGQATEVLVASLAKAHLNR